MNRWIAALLAAAACTSIARAQTPPPAETVATLSLDQALASAGVTAPSLEAAEADIRAAEAGRAVAGLRPNPQITVEAENVAGSGPYRGLDGAETTGLGDFYRRLWASGNAGTDIQLTILKGSKVQEVNITSMERSQYLRPQAIY